MTAVPLSVLDLSPISAGSDAAAALRNSVDLARCAEAWGYRRFWLAEHHLAAVASSRPAVLAGQIAAATATIRVGSAAVQLGQDTALSAVESFGVLASFYPGRIDLGVGRSSARRKTVPAVDPPRPEPEAAPPPWREVDGVVIPPPFDLRAMLANPRVRAAAPVLVQPHAQPGDFAEQIADIEAMLTGTFTRDGHAFHATPGEGTDLVPWIFGSSRGESARVAGAHGLPFVASYHITPGTALDAVAVYRDHFVASRHLTAPYVVVSADAVVAADGAHARWLASSYGQWVASIRSGAGAMPYPDPADCPPLTDAQHAAVADRLGSQLVGDPEEVVARLAALQRHSGADELVVTTVTFDHRDRLRSYELLAEAWRRS